MTLTNFNLGRAACTSCHGDSGEGTPLGPDLTGKKWLWSDGSYSGVKKTITEGVSQQNNIAAPCRLWAGRNLRPTRYQRSPRMCGPEPSLIAQSPLIGWRVPVDYSNVRVEILADNPELEAEPYMVRRAFRLSAWSQPVFLP